MVIGDALQDVPVQGEIDSLNMFYKIFIGMEQSMQALVLDSKMQMNYILT